MTEEELALQQVQQILEEMTLEQKLYQMFIVTPEQLTGVDTVIAAGDTTKNSLSEYPVGGLIYFAHNLKSEQQTRQMLENTQTFAKESMGLPLFLCVDEEGGSVARIADNPSFHVPKVEAMQTIKSETAAYEAGETIGSYLERIGFNVDFAPDADVLTAEGNTVIGDRSFGSDPDAVTHLACAYSDGLHAHQILSTFKHFPGHGAVNEDTHEGFAYTDKTYEELAACELKPFMEAQKRQVDMVMVAHISVPVIVGDGTPCTLSYEMTTEVLREKCGYEGLIVTDALNMGAITGFCTPGEAAVGVVKAGADLILMPKDFAAAFGALQKAVEQGEIESARIDDSVRRIIAAKLRLE